MRSPISTPDIPDPTPPSAETIAVATDQALFAVITTLIKKGLIDAGELAGALKETSSELASSSAAKPGQEMAMLGASLAVGRLSSEVSNITQEGQATPQTGPRSP